MVIQGFNFRTVCRTGVKGLLCLSIFLSGCVFTPLNPDYDGPPARPAELDTYYNVGLSYTNVSEELLEASKRLTIKRIILDTEFGKATIDYFSAGNTNDDLILVYPILGGRNIFANYFARYFAIHGFDAAIIHRDGSFKDPEKVEQLETIFRDSVRRDRIALNFFENVYGKKDFGTFGLSRGAINAAMTAGVDKRLKYNVLALGGENLVGIFNESEERGIEKFKRRAMEKLGMTEAEFFAYLTHHIKTDPKELAQYMDAKHALMFLSVFDTSVPVRYGVRLRHRIGRPDTVFLPTGHYTTLLYTRFVNFIPPGIGDPDSFGLFDYIETESLAFYRKSFGRSGVGLKELPIRLFQLPFRIFGQVIEAIF